MKTTEETKHTIEYRLEEVLKILVPNQTPSVDYDGSVMRLKDGGTILVLELQTTRVKT
jgi:hypothetical protein